MFQLGVALRRDFRSVLIVVWELLRDGLQFMNVVARSRMTVAVIAAARLALTGDQPAPVGPAHMRSDPRADVIGARREILCAKSGKGPRRIGTILCGLTAKSMGMPGRFENVPNGATSRSFGAASGLR